MVYLTESAEFDMNEIETAGEEEFDMRTRFENLLHVMDV